MSTCSPPSKSINDGMLLTLYSSASSLFESTSTLHTDRFSEYFSASSSSLGAICLHGPHHSAQKSTRTNLDSDKTSVEKVSFVVVLVFFRGYRISPVSSWVAELDVDYIQGLHSLDCTDCIAQIA